MKRPWISLPVTCMVLCFFSMQKAYAHNNSPSVNLDKTVLEKRFEALCLPMEVSFDPQFIPFIKEYLVNGRKESEKILSRGALYFPIFEYHLKSYNLPPILKYLPVVESRLLPKATSYAGAGGLWQFMPRTAKMYGLQINKYIDQRLSPERSSGAAVRLLADLHQEFDDWLLALAAYNCGPSRVHRAIRREKCKNYWDIRYRLPRQTQKYINRFLAATYVFSHQDLHGLNTPLPNADPLQTKTIRIHHHLSLRDIERRCGIDPNTLKHLNPVFLEGVIPSSPSGYLLTLPSRFLPTFYHQFSDRIYLEPIAQSKSNREERPTRCPQLREMEAVAQKNDCRAVFPLLEQLPKRDIVVYLDLTEADVTL